MRTTLTIDDDVAAELERLRRTRDASLKHLVNEALRHGLREMAGPPKSRKPFRTRSIDAGTPLIPNLDCIGEVLAFLDAEEFTRR
jgi:hypothetical protein